jgi:cell division protein FtsB
VGALAVLVYAIEGGEYGTSDLLTQRERKNALAQEVAELERDVDSLRAELKAVTSDPVRLERMAREEWGMVRGEKELLYRMRTDTSRAP